MTFLLLLCNQGVSALQVLLDERIFELGDAFLQLPINIFVSHGCCWEDEEVNIQPDGVSGSIWLPRFAYRFRGVLLLQADACSTLDIYTIHIYPGYYRPGCILVGLY